MRKKNVKTKNATQLQKKREVYGESTVTVQTCQKWFANFNGDFSLNDALVETDGD